MRFVVKSVGVDANVRGQRMRRVTLAAVEGDEFASDDKLPDGAQPAPPEGHIALVLGVKAAKRFAVGDEFDLAFHERE